MVKVWFITFLPLLLQYVSVSSSCDLDRCVTLRKTAELAFNKENSIFCRSLQNYLICLRKLSPSCIQDSHVRQVISRYSISCVSFTGGHTNGLKMSYFEDKKNSKTSITDDLYDDIDEKSKKIYKKNDKNDDKFDDIGENSKKGKFNLTQNNTQRGIARIKSGKNRKRKIGRTYNNRTKKDKTTVNIELHNHHTDDRYDDTDDKYDDTAADNRKEKDKTEIDDLFDDRRVKYSERFKNDIFYNAFDNKWRNSKQFLRRKLTVNNRQWRKDGLNNENRNFVSRFGKNNHIYQRYSDPNESDNGEYKEFQIKKNFNKYDDYLDNLSSEEIFDSTEKANDDNYTSEEVLYNAENSHNRNLTSEEVSDSMENEYDDTNYWGFSNKPKQMHTAFFDDIDDDYLDDYDGGKSLELDLPDADDVYSKMIRSNINKQARFHTWTNNLGLQLMELKDEFYDENVMGIDDFDDLHESSENDAFDDVNENVLTYKPNVAQNHLHSEYPDSSEETVTSVARQLADSLAIKQSSNLDRGESHELIDDILGDRDDFEFDYFREEQRPYFASSEEEYQTQKNIEQGGASGFLSSSTENSILHDSDSDELHNPILFPTLTNNRNTKLRKSFASQQFNENQLQMPTFPQGVTLSKNNSLSKQFLIQDDNARHVTLQTREGLTPSVRKERLFKKEIVPNSSQKSGQQTWLYDGGKTMTDRLKTDHSRSNCMSPLPTLLLLIVLTSLNMMLFQRKIFPNL